MVQARCGLLREGSAGALPRSRCGRGEQLERDDGEERIPSLEDCFRAQPGKERIPGTALHREVPDSNRLRIVVHRYQSAKGATIVLVLSCC